ncbi:NAD dependent epimerase/dehydratase [Whalleya microplaca]|nr:NAD dependent epimerase/dehydratase [Whalleya microplaca]
MSPPKVLLTGATGYIGGTVLNQLVTSTSPNLEAVTVSILVRGEERAAKLRGKYGDRIVCILFKDFDEIPLITEVASQHDIIINAGSGFHPASAEAMVRGLAQRKAATGKPVWMLHTSGCSNISDRPITDTAYPDREWDDADAEAVYEFEKATNEREWYAQRTSELAVLDTGIELGVNTLSIQVPNMCGTGEGLFQNASLMIPIMMGYVLARGYGFTLGDGTGAIDYVHISDLAALYVLLLQKILEDGGKDLPTGKKGIIFPTNGRSRTYDIAQRCVDVAFETGALPKPDGPQEKEVRTVDIAEAATTTAGNTVIAETGWAGHRLTKGTVARKLGWNPTRGEDAWHQDFYDELKAALAGKRGVTIDNCINETATK